MLKSNLIKPIRHIFFVFRKRASKIEKRFRFAISVIALALLLGVATLFYFQQALYFIPFLILASFIAAYFSLLEGINKIGWFGLFFMPIMVTVSFYLFYFLFPGRWLTRVPFTIIYAISFYATLLCSNIFNIGVEKSLQLYRAAFSVNFFFQSITMFVILNLLYSLRLPFVFNALGTGIMTGLFSGQLFWTIRLKKQLEYEVLHYAIFVGYILMQLALILSFVPVDPVIMSLFITALYYSLAGIIYHYIDQKLFKETIREYVIVLIFVFTILILSLNW